MKVYKGKRLGPRNSLPPVEVTVQDGTITYPLPHLVYHSPTGFEWGYLGSGPADLARSILFDCLGVQLANKLYQEFKQKFVSRWGDEWQITSSEILNWAVPEPDAEPLFKGTILVSLNADEADMVIGALIECHSKDDPATWGQASFIIRAISDAALKARSSLDSTLELANLAMYESLRS